MPPSHGVEAVVGGVDPKSMEALISSDLSQSSKKGSLYPFPSPPKLGGPREEMEAKDLVMLAACLEDLGLPPIEDRTAQPRRDTCPDAITVVMISEPENRMSAALEGGRQAPGSVFLILNPDWLERRGPKADGLYSLYMHKGIWFDKVGKGYLDTFIPPRKTTYLANFFTMPASDGLREDGVPLEEDLDCPISSSSVLERITNDKLHTRILLSKARVAHPVCCAFTFHNPMSYDITGCPGILSVTDLPDRTGNTNVLSRDIERFASMLMCPRIVIKPSGPMWMGSQGVSFWERSNVVGMVAAAEDLLLRLWDGDSILVEEFLPTIGSTHISPGNDALSPTHRAQTETLDSTRFGPSIDFDGDDVDKPAGDDDADEDSRHGKPMFAAGLSGSLHSQHEFGGRKSLGFRLRVMVARAPWGEPVVTKMLCGVGVSSKPINGSNTIPISMDAVLTQWGIVSAEKKKKIVDIISAESVAVMKAIMEYEKGMDARLRGGVGAQTDLIGIDFIMTSTQRGIVPIVIEVNDHDCSLQAQTLEFTLREKENESVQMYVANAISRSEDFILRNRRILVVGGGGFSKKFVWDGCAELGVNVVVVDDDAAHFARDLVSDFLVLEGLSDHKRDMENANRIVDLLKSKGIVVEGCVSFWEDCAPLASLVAAKLGLNGNSHASQSLAKSKYDTQVALMALNVEHQHKCTTSMFASRVYRLHTEEDAQKAWADLGGVPGVLKLEFGSSACGVVMVRTLEECVQQFQSLKSHLKEEEDHRGVGLGFGSAIILMEYVDGSEHDVDIVMFNGHIVNAFVTDNGPTRIPLFCETAASMPSRLHRDNQGMLIAAAAQCCFGLGLRSGVFNVEFKQTGCGPKLLEINARMGGFYIRDWVRRVWGVDLLKANLLISLGIRPVVYPSRHPRTHIVGRMLYGSMNRVALTGAASVERLRELHASKAIVLNQLEKDIPTPEEIGRFEEPFASVGCTGRDTNTAKGQLLNLWRILGLEQGDKPCTWYLKCL